MTQSRGHESCVDEDLEAIVRVLGEHAVVDQWATEVDALRVISVDPYNVNGVVRIDCDVRRGASSSSISDRVRSDGHVLDISSRAVEIILGWVKKRVEDVGVGNLPDDMSSAL